VTTAHYVGAFLLGVANALALVWVLVYGLLLIDQHEPSRMPHKTMGPR